MSEARDALQALLGALKDVHERRPGTTSSKDALVADIPAVRELMEARKARERAQRRCAELSLKTSLVTDASL